MKIAIVQDGPIFNDIDNTVEKTISLIKEASQKGTDLIVFGESWLSGYPVWLDICKDVNLWDHKPIKELWANTYEAAIEVGSHAFETLASAIADYNIYTVLGCNEKRSTGKGNNSLFNTIFTFDRTGELVNHHRKLMPTYTEKLVHAYGDGAGLNSVETDFGRLGSLICWEHWMPMTRQVMHDEAEDLHIALWPFVKEMHHIASRQYAIEGRCHVVSVGQIMHKDELPKNLEISDSIDIKDDGLIMRGGSAIYGPDGAIIQEPIYDDRGVFYFDLDLKSNLKERMNLSVSGHYQRPDVFKYSVDKRREL